MRVWATEHKRFFLNTKCLGSGLEFGVKGAEGWISSSLVLLLYGSQVSGGAWNHVFKVQVQVLQKTCFAFKILRVSIRSRRNHRVIKQSQSDQKGQLFRSELAMAIHVINGGEGALQLMTGPCMTLCGHLANTLSTAFLKIVQLLHIERLPFRNLW